LTLLPAGERRYPDSPDRARLEVFRNPRPGRPYAIRFDCPEFTALCPITGQPDFGVITLEYTPRAWCVESKSLKLYLFSFRSQGTFHEEAVNRILDDVVRACRPRWARVTGAFRPRGGIALTVAAEYPAARAGRKNGAGPKP
jgi:7-cyano-7-deazaguanine reductase